MASIELSFPDSDLAHAGQFARQLRQNLIAGGVPASRLDIERTRDDTMDMGTTLMVALEVGSHVVEGLAVINGLYEIFVKNHCAVRIKTSKGEIKIGRGEADWERFRALLADVLDVGSS